MSEEKTQTVELSLDELREILSHFPKLKEMTPLQFRLSTKLQVHILEREDKDAFLKTLSIENDKDFVNINITRFDVFRKVESIRFIRQLTGIGLKEAKDFIEGVSTISVPRKIFYELQKNPLNIFIELK